MKVNSNLDGLVIRRTFEEDLENVRTLWSRGDVMAFVGFPTGLQRSIADMERWLARKLANAPLEQHFSIYDAGVFCGEAYYRIEPEHDHAACMDIKLLPSARGRRIASTALSFALDQAFEHGASFAWVDPVPENLAAIALYRHLGFEPATPPAFISQLSYPDVPEPCPSSVYMEISARKWRRVRGQRHRS